MHSHPAENYFEDINDDHRSRVAGTGFDLRAELEQKEQAIAKETHFPPNNGADRVLPGMVEAEKETLHIEAAKRAERYALIGRLTVEGKININGHDLDIIRPFLLTRSDDYDIVMDLSQTNGLCFTVSVVDSRSAAYDSLPEGLYLKTKNGLYSAPNVVDMEAYEKLLSNEERQAELVEQCLNGFRANFTAEETMYLLTVEEVVERCNVEVGSVSKNRLFKISCC